MTRRIWAGGLGKLAAFAVAMLLMAGCQGKGKPFADVVEGNQKQSLHTAAPTDEASPVAQAPAAPTPAAEPAPEARTAVPAVAAPLPATAAAVPLIVGERGLLRRPWPISVAYRPSGDVFTGPTYYQQTNEQVPDRPEWLQAAIETPMFLVHTVLSPVGMVKTPPWTHELSNSDPGGWRWQPLDPAEHLYAE
jgi:hypothetical protein